MRGNRACAAARPLGQVCCLAAVAVCGGLQERAISRRTWPWGVGRTVGCEAWADPDVTCQCHCALATGARAPVPGSGKSETELQARSVSSWVMNV